LQRVAEERRGPFLNKSLLVVFINTVNPESFKYELFKGFSTQNVESRPGGKPLNLKILISLHTKGGIPK
jgi:hypothetical protein